MADTKTSDLTSLTGANVVQTTDVIPIVDTDATTLKKILVSEMAQAIEILATEQASTSGTSIDFTSIPAWAKRITIQFVGVSSAGTSEVMIQLGDSGGFEATGYTSSTANITGSSAGQAASTTGFIVSAGGTAANVVHGALVLTLEDATNFTWVAMGITHMSNSGRVVMCSGTKSTSAALTQVRVTMINGTDEFDAGAINILYE